MELYYFGYSLKMLKYLIDFSKSNYNNLRFKGVITQLGKYSSEFINVCKTNDLPINIINSKKELIDICEEKNIKNVIMYEFGIIVPEKICQNSKVINFHPGSLSTNRGANPINWSILIPGIGAEICAYKILPQIDCGDIVSSKSEEVTLFDTPHTLKEKLEKNEEGLYVLKKEYQKDTGRKERPKFIISGEISSYYILKKRKLKL